jgi:hypothetical protein
VIDPVPAWTRELLEEYDVAGLLPPDAVTIALADDVCGGDVQRVPDRSARPVDRRCRVVR